MSHLSREIVTLVPMYPMQIFPNIALAILTTIDQIFPLFQRYMMENSTPEVDLVELCDTGILGDAKFIARYRNTRAYVFNANFSQFCVSYVDGN